jgi:hypothetical protein
MKLSLTGIVLPTRVKLPDASVNRERVPAATQECDQHELDIVREVVRHLSSLGCSL